MNTAAIRSAIEPIRDRLLPSETLTDEDRGRGMRLVVADGIASQAMETMTGGVFLAAFAIALGASNLTIGFLAAIPSLAQLIQVPCVLLVERMRARRYVTVLAALGGRSCIVLSGALMVLLPKQAMGLLICAAIVHAVTGAVAGCSWNSWMRDLLPVHQVNRFFARRMMYSALLGAGLSVITVSLLNLGTARWPEHRITLFGLLFMAGGVCGLIGLGFVWQTPEMRMRVSAEQVRLSALLAEPFRARNYRRLMGFLAIWSFAVNLATPFFTVYMLKSLALDLSTVTTLAVVSQLAHVASIRCWAHLADQAGSRKVLRIAGYLFLLALFGWMFTGRAEAVVSALPMLVTLHVLLGVATAGLALGMTSISLKLAPAGRATPYLAMNAVTMAMAGGLAPIVGGASADFFATRELGITVRWLTPVAELSVAALQMRHWQFYFAFAFCIGLCALLRLRHVREPGLAKNRRIV